MTPISSTRGHALRPRAAALGLALLACLAPACTSAPTGPLPDPLPATLDWAMAPAEEGSFLGLTVRENDSGSLEALSFDPGARVTAVALGSPAAEAGIQIGDVLLKLDGVEVNDPGGLENLVAALEPGREIQAQVQRGDSGFALPLTLRARSGAGTSNVERLWRADPARSQAGWLAGHGGVVLVTSSEDGPFPRAGVAVGSVVRSIDGEAMISDLDLVKRLQAAPEGARVEVEYEGPRGGELRQARVKLAEPNRRVTRFGVPVLVNYSSDPEGTATSFAVLDLWIISLFRYERDGVEKRWSLLRFFRFSTGIGELGS